jgi:hypothetical protein
MSHEEATRIARLEMGSVLAVRDAVGDVGWAATWEAAWRDVRYGVRSLARNASFTLAAVTTLALAVGITTAVFSIVNTVLLQPLPYRDSDRLVRIVERAAPGTVGGPLLRRTSPRLVASVMVAVPFLTSPFNGTQSIRLDHAAPVDSGSVSACSTVWQPARCALVHEHVGQRADLVMNFWAVGISSQTPLRAQEYHDGFDTNGSRGRMVAIPHRISAGCQFRLP